MSSDWQLEIVEAGAKILNEDWSSPLRFVNKMHRILRGDHFPMLPAKMVNHGSPFTRAHASSVVFAFRTHESLRCLGLENNPIHELLQMIQSIRMAMVVARPSLHYLIDPAFPRT